MNRRELLRKAAKSNISQKDLDMCMSALTQAIIDSLREGNRVHMKGLGAFEAKTRRSSQCRNPRTGKIMMTKNRTVVKFTMYTSFSNQLNQGVGSS